MDQTKTQTAIRDIAEAAAESVQVTAQKPNDLSATAVANTKGQIVRDMTEALKRLPEIQHIFSLERWWQARTNWAVIFGVIASLSGVQVAVVKVTGWTWFHMSPDDVESWSTLAAIIASVVSSIFARWARTATKPLGT